MAFLGVDIGTGGCKATVCDEKGRLYGSAYAEYGVLHSRGFHELDANEVWDDIRSVIRRAVEQSPGQRVEAICTSSLGEAAVPVDRDRHILGNAMVYTDCRGQSEMESICASVGKLRVGQITGVDPNRMYTVNKVMWIKEHEPERYRQTYKFLEFEDFLTFMLTGRACVSYSLASRTMAFDVVKKRWSGEILAAAGVPESKFSAPCSTGTVVGKILPEMAGELGLSKDVRVIVGAQDQVCAAVGAGILEDGMAVDGMGSTHCITPVFDRPVISESSLNAGYCCCPYVTDGMYAVYAYNFCGGNLIRWFCDVFARKEREESAARGVSVYRYLDGLADREPNDLLVLPHFIGAGPPYMDDDSRGILYGMTLNSGFPQIYRAFLEGISFEMKHNLDALAEEGVPIRTLRACGGGANSKIWLQIQSDIFEMPIQRLESSEAGTLGCAAICGTALGAFRDLREGASAYLKIGETYEPEPAYRSYYRNKYEQFLRLYGAGRGIRGEERKKREVEIHAD